MYTHTSYIRVRYAETDQMGYVYYGNYATYFEVARVEALRALGFSYAEMEISGIMMPVLHMAIKYIRPAKYDDLLEIKLTIPTLPNTRIKFEYEIFNHGGVLLNVADTTLVFVNMQTNKPCYAPPDLQATFAKYFDIATIEAGTTAVGDGGLNKQLMGDNSGNIKQ